jgi:glycine/D-amino acid oxidase-like deaminating enzyme
MTSTKTTWNDTKGLMKKDYGSFSGNKSADVVIVGGGITGIVSAYLLAKAGKKVVVLEKETVGSGITSYTTAFLTQSLDTEASSLIKSFGEDTARKIFDSHGKAVNLVEKIIKEENIDCDFSRCSNYLYTHTEKDLDSLEEESKMLQSLGIHSEVVRNGSELGFDNKGYLDIKNQGKFHPLKFIFALAEKAEKLGVEFYEHSEVLKMETAEHGHQKVTLTTGEIDAGYVIVATYKPFDNPLKLYFKKGTYVSYVIELQVKNMNLKEGVYEDTSNPYHYLRVDKHEGGHRVVLGGSDHREDVPVNKTKSFNALIEYADSIIPKENRTITHRWIGQMLEPVDGLPSIGRIDDRNVLYTIAFSGNGMTYSSIAAMMFADIISGKDNPWISVYSPLRKQSLKALLIKGRDYAQEMLGGAVKNTFTQSKTPRT